MDGFGSRLLHTMYYILFFLFVLFPSPVTYLSPWPDSARGTQTATPKRDHDTIDSNTPAYTEHLQGVVADT